MKYADFINVMKEEVGAKVEEPVTVQLFTTTKNNGKERIGLNIIEQGVNISPTIYLEEFYKRYQGGESICSMVDCIMKLYEEVRFHRSWNADIIEDYNRIQKKIVFKLINYEKNKELLKKVPYKKYLDLAIVCYVMLELYDTATATMLIREQNLKQWNVTKEDIYKEAFLNSQKILPYFFKPISEVVEDMICEAGDGKVPFERDRDYEPMYVLSNTVKSYGASVILYDHVLENIGEELGENFYVIPSSVHEVIIVPESECYDREALESMITEINEKEVEEEEILSNHPYFYHKKEGRLLY